MGYKYLIAPLLEVDATSGAFNKLAASQSWSLEEIAAYGRNQVIGTRNAGAAGA